MKLFGDDRRIELACKRTLLASLVCIVWTLIALLAYWHGEIPATGMAALAAFNVGAIVLFLVAIRSGWSLRFRDMGLTQAQMVAAILCMCAIYALMPQTRAGTVQTMCLILVFGTFSLSVKECIRMGFALAAFPLLTVFVLATSHPETFSWSQDGVPAIGGSTIMLIMARLLSHFCGIRQMLMTQRNELKALMSQTETLAATDELTGLLNRRRMAELTELALARHVRSSTPICLAILDVDHFKRVNDLYGHHIGDEVLTGIANVLKAGLRTTDLLARWGGEEFIVVLPDADAVNVKLVLDRILLDLMNLPVSRTSPDIRVAFSAGVAQWNTAESFHDCVERADHAMYRAKDSGRSRCVIAV